MTMRLAALASILLGVWGVVTDDGCLRSGQYFGVLLETHLITVFTVLFRSGMLSTGMAKVAGL